MLVSAVLVAAVLPVRGNRPSQGNIYIWCLLHQGRPGEIGTSTGNINIEGFPQERLGGTGILREISMFRASLREGQGELVKEN